MAISAALPSACAAETASETLAVEKFPEAEFTEAEACSQLLEPLYSVQKGLNAQLGDWGSCERTEYEETKFGTNQTFILSWEGVKLTVEFQTPETGIYVVETQGKSPLTSDWFETAKDEMIAPFFAMMWDYDDFPGPTSQYFSSKDEGTNGQVWIERNAQGAITWMRFSYAL